MERPRILMVEDNVGDAVLLREYLAEKNFVCDICHCRLLAEALAELDRAPVQIVLLDLILPDSNGLPTFEAVHRHAPNVPIVILTGFADEELAAQAVKAGAQDYLPKDDINGTQLTRTVRYAIERKRAEQTLHQAKEAAEAANKAKDRFLASLSHELRTPLTPVLAQVQLLERDTSLRPEVREAMTMIRRHIELEARLIDDLLDVTRVSSGKMELHPQVVDLHQLVRHSLQFCRQDAEAKRITIRCDLAAEGAHIRADPDRMQQVLWNLLANAVKFTPPDGVVRVSTTIEGQERVRLTIADSGIGIDPQLLPRIFEPFEQGHRSVTRTFGGLGLGLAIARSIVALHEGSLTAHSEGEGRGSQFVMELRTVTAETAAATASRRLSAPATMAPLRILLVEDHAATARVLSLLLQGLGHAVDHQRSVADGLRAAAERPHELLISDIGLPDGTGMDLLKRLRAQGAQLPAIVISGYGAAEDIRESQAAGFVRHLTKPFSDRALIDAIQRATTRSQEAHRHG